MRKAKGRNRLIEKLEKDKEIFPDLLVDNFDEHTLNAVFGTEEKLNYGEKIIHVAQEILKGRNEHLETLIKYNNEYIRLNKYDAMTEEEYKKEFGNAYIRSMHGTGIAPEQMILYALTTNELKEKLNLFEWEYAKFKAEVCEKEDDTIRQLSRLPELLQGTYMENEFQGFIQNDYIGKENVDFEELGKRYGLEYDKKSDTYKSIPSGFLVFFENKIQDIYNKQEIFQLNFGLLHGNLVRVNKYLERIKEQEKVFEGIEKENTALKKINSELEKENNSLRLEILAVEEKEKDKAIKGQAKEIKHLYAKIEALEEELENTRQDSKLELIEDVEIEEPGEKEKRNLKGLKIKVIGGKWNSRTIGEMEESADSEGFEIEFIKADEIFRNAEKIKNSDLIIFDTSLNSHAGYYKIKSFSIETLHLRKSTKEEIKKLFEI